MIIGFLAALPGLAQMQVNTTLTPAQLVQNVLVGGGVAVSNVTFNGMVATTAQPGSGSFTNGNSTNLGLNAGLILSSGLATSAVGNANDFGSDDLGTGSDPDLVAITTPGNTINDKAIIEFDFIPDGDSLNFSYVFGSEEYPGFNCSPNYNDVFGFFLSGPGITGPYTNNAANIALVPGTTLPVGIANIHGSGGSCGPANAQYYVDNSNGTTIALNGFTTVLRAQASVTCGETYHIKLAIGDAGDESYNSAVFLQAGSFSSNQLPSLTASTMYGNGTAAEGCDGGHFTIFRPEGVDSTVTVNYMLSGTATPGVDYLAMPNPAVIPAGQDSVVLPFQAIEDGIAEGFETAIMSVYVVNSCGDTLTNSVVLAILDYTPMTINSPSPLVLECDQDSVPIFASVTGGFGEVTMAWGDTLQTNHIYVPGRQSGVYTVSTFDECPRSVSVDIVVDDGCAIIIPNVITPNGDGHNDRFVVKGIEGRENQVRIYDRWGKEVLNATNYRNTFAATDLNDGVYFYLIRVKDKDYTGHLQVLGSR